MNSVNVVQLNCHNAYQAMMELSLGLSKHSNIIALIQELYVSGKKKMSNKPTGYDHFPSSTDSHQRSAIFSSRSLKLTEINELCNDYTVTVGGIIDNNRIMFVSIYLHYDKAMIDVMLTKI